MAKKRGLDMKLYRNTTALVAALSATPAIGTWLEVTTVSKVTKSFKGNETTIETRESADDIVLASGRVSEFTVSIPCDLGDAHYGAFIQASNAQTPITLLFGVNALNLAGDPNDIQVGNFSITEEDSDESKKEGVIVNFKCKPASYYSRVIDLS